MASSGVYLRECLRDGPAVLVMGDRGDASQGLDFSRFGRNGTVNGTLTRAQIARGLGGSYTQDGANGNYLSWGDNSAYSSHAGSAGEQTIEVWFNVASFAAFNSVYWKSSASYEFTGSVSTGGVATVEWTNSTASASNAAQSPSGFIQAGVTYHMVGTFSNIIDEVRLWLNGRPIARTAVSITSSDTATSMYLGARGDAANNRFNGSLGGFAIYPRVLQPHRIRAHYRAGLGRVIPG